MVFTTRKIVIYAATAFLAIVAMAILFVYQLSSTATTNPSQQINVTVKPGMTAGDIGRILQDKGLINNILIFQIVAKLDGLDNSLQAGEYVLNTNMTLQQITAKLSQGQTVFKEMTIPEGYTVNEIAKLIEEKRIGSAAKFKTVAKNYAPFNYMENRSQISYPTEGFLFPDTYQITENMTEEQIAKMMVSQFDKQVTPAMRKKAGDMGLSIVQLITLASLVEKEAQKEAERPIIAGVFINRLRQGMPLQSCATIQYILGNPKAELSVRDTEIPSPYNTYQNIGLPPGPIANPGIASIKAVLNPAATDYLYFVADKSGAHSFSRTYEEHIAAINRVTQ